MSMHRAKSHTLPKKTSNHYFLVITKTNLEETKQELIENLLSYQLLDINYGMTSIYELDKAKQKITLN